MSKCLDPDVKAIARCIRALDGSSSVTMLRANLDFLVDRYITHPIAAVVERERLEREAIEAKHSDQKETDRG